jgi:peptidoglycan/xylan/chitin deacetylase (PgdA/CDA1 family)
MRERIQGAFPPSSELELRSPMLEAGDFAELRKLKVEIGNHTHSHVHCGALAPHELQTEIVTARDELVALSGGAVRAFSVAYGHERDLPPTVLEVLRESGHKAIFLVHARSNLVRKAPDVWYRVSFRNESVARLPMRLSVLPLIRSARDLVLS